ncbi:MAG: lysylphosphatidylglycerol synthase transmembrane domain-containing protein [Betaproteobacteria bacterium]|nr:lysylphosphatidylglycerol synthase transmembrane domain-containing protein [Betaproteobacteria bacterium]
MFTRAHLSVLALGVSLAIPLFLTNARHTLTRLETVPPGLVALGLAMVALGWTFNAARLRLLCAHIGHRLPVASALAMVVSTEFAGASTPGGIGSALAYVFQLHRRGVHSAQAASLYAVDHLMDLAFFGSAFPLAVIGLVLDGRGARPLWVALAALGPLAGGALLIVVFMRAPPRGRRASALMARWFRLSPERRLRHARWWVSFRSTVRTTMAMPRARLALLYANCAGHWLLRYSILPLILAGLGHPLPWSYLFLMQGALLFAGQLSMLPGGAGGVELGFAALLAGWTDRQTIALSLVLWRFATFYWYLLLGGVVFATTMGRQRARADGI